MSNAPVIIFHQIKKIMTLIDRGIQLSKEHQLVGKTTQQSNNRHGSISSLDIFKVQGKTQVHWNTLLLDSLTLLLVSCDCTC